MTELCQCCNKPLNRSQYKEGTLYKSCPRCSQLNGNEHVYHRFPKHFGTTPKRASRRDPKGAQSYCNACRSGGEMISRYYLCSELSSRSGSAGKEEQEGIFLSAR